MALQVKSTDTTFCEIDINRPEEMEKIKNAIGLILKMTYNY